MKPEQQNQVSSVAVETFRNKNGNYCMRVRKTYAPLIEEDFKEFYDVETFLEHRKALGGYSSVDDLIPPPYKEEVNNFITTLFKKHFPWI